MFNKHVNCRASPMLFVLVCIAAMLSISLAGCGAFAPAQTTAQKIAYSYGVHTAVVNATTVALNSKTIKSSDAEHVLALATDSRKLLDAAKLAFSAGDVKTAEGQLALATSILTQLQAYLSTSQ